MEPAPARPGGFRTGICRPPRGSRAAHLLVWPSPSGHQLPPVEEMVLLLRPELVVCSVSTLRDLPFSPAGELPPWGS